MPEEALTYVLDIDGNPLMPTKRCGKVRRLLKAKKAKVVKRTPFTIQLLYEPDTHVVQPVTLGVDAGSKHIGLSACTDTKELYAEDAQLRTDVSNKLTARREARRTRRNRKTRYRKPRFNNRVHSKHKGWLAPSVEQKIECHLNAIRKVMKILPVVIRHFISFKFWEKHQNVLLRVSYPYENYLDVFPLFILHTLFSNQVTIKQED